MWLRGMLIYWVPCHNPYKVELSSLFEELLARYYTLYYRDLLVLMKSKATAEVLLDRYCS